jgi:hypothetical protein
VRVVLAWHASGAGEAECRAAPPHAEDSWRPLAATSTSEYWSRRHMGSTVTTPSYALRPSTLLDDEFDPRRLAKHPVTVLDLGRGGIHLIAGVPPRRDRDHWIGIEEDGAFVWSKVVLRSLSEPSVGTYLARFSFTGPCPYELIRRALVGRPPASKHDSEPGLA